LPVFVKTFGPGLKRSDFARIRDIGQQTLAIHANIGAGFLQNRSGRAGPVSGFPRHYAQTDVTIGPARCELGRFRNLQERRRRSVEFLPVGQDHGFGICLFTAIAREGRLDRHGVTDFYRLLCPAVPLEFNPAGEFDGPAGDISASLRDIENDKNVGIRPVELGNGALQRHWLFLVVLSGE